MPRSGTSSSRRSNAISSYYSLLHRSRTICENSTTSSRSFDQANSGRGGSSDGSTWSVVIQGERAVPRRFASFDFALVSLQRRRDLWRHTPSWMSWTAFWQRRLSESLCSVSTFRRLTYLNRRSVRLGGPSFHSVDRCHESSEAAV